MNQANMDQELVKWAAEIVTANSYGQGFQAAELVETLRAVYEGLKSLSKPPKGEAESIRDWRTSIQESCVECLLCGRETKVLAPHLRKIHQMTLEDYRRRFQIPKGVALISREIKAKRSQAAKEKGLITYLRG